MPGRNNERQRDWCEPAPVHRTPSTKGQQKGRKGGVPFVQRCLLQCCVQFLRPFSSEWSLQIQRPRRGVHSHANGFTPFLSVWKKRETEREKEKTELVGVPKFD